jgi:cell division protein FtsI/penicillin-binding protein 2
VQQAVIRGHRTSGARGRRSSRARRRRLFTRAAPLAGLALLAFVVGIIVATSSGGDERQVVQRYVTDWQRGNYAGMYALLDERSQRDISEPGFVTAYKHAAAVATITGLARIRVSDPNGQAVPVSLTVHTRVFGRVRGTVDVPFTSSSSGTRVRYEDTILFPGLRPGEQLRRQVSLAPRAAILARDGTPLAQGPDRTSPIPSVALQIAGRLGPIPAADGETYLAYGYPHDAKVGLNGLERVFEQQLAGTPGGTLFAGSRVLARTAPVAGRSVTTTIDPAIESAATAAMGANLAGIVAMDPRNGQLLALAGIAFSAPQPPGSTMKIITSTGALEAGIVTLGSTFPIQTSSTIDGYTLQNAGGEACGGTFLNAFAVSCNSVFAPLGAKLGAAKLVNVAERFGFNQPPQFPGEAESVIPPANQMTSNLDVGSSAIGQGRVLSTPLEMTEAGATIAMGGRRPIPTLQMNSTPRFAPVTTPSVAGEVQHMMVAVVQYGTGTAAQISGVQVAGKTGTAELRNTATPGASTAANTDAWFVGYAPVGTPRIVVGALFPNQGAGGATAAPAVHDVLVAALAQHY